MGEWVRRRILTIRGKITVILKIGIGKIIKIGKLGTGIRGKTQKIGEIKDLERKWQKS